MKFDRYPSTTDASLKAWNAADELILHYIENENIKCNAPIIFNDRFGYLACHLIEKSPQVIGNYRSQEKAIDLNLRNNDLPQTEYYSPLLTGAKPTDLGIIKIPKSLDLFQFMLHHLFDKLSDDGLVICGFMTKYFSPQFLTIAEAYFENIIQTKAQKKARLMILQGKKDKPKVDLIESFNWNQHSYQQYLGVFSSGHIDYATQFFLEHLNVSTNEQNILDLASGNGVIARFVRDRNSEATIHLCDDSWLAIASSKLNLENGKNIFHYADNLEQIENNSLDLVVSNPPFHFDFETNIDITFSLFKEVKTKLKSGGRFELVANRHLPYKPVLEELFKDVIISADNKKFIIYSCI
ncbi:MAG: methyltransferase [Flavobacteriales bacterium]|nr:methyltransferase [Flavobacteriales bacterium]